MPNKIPNYEDILDKIKNSKLKILSNEEIRLKRQAVNKNLLLIHKLIQEGKFSDAEKVAIEMLKANKHVNGEELV